MFAVVFSVVKLKKFVSLFCVWPRVCIYYLFPDPLLGLHRIALCQWSGSLGTHTREIWSVDLCWVTILLLGETSYIVPELLAVVKDRPREV